MSATMPNPTPVAPESVTDTELDVQEAVARPFYGLPRNPADPTVAGSIHLALWMIADRKRQEGVK